MSIGLGYNKDIVSIFVLLFKYGKEKGVECGAEMDHGDEPPGRSESCHWSHLVLEPGTERRE